jgi:hypothetical protein
VLSMPRATDTPPSDPLAAGCSPDRPDSRGGQVPPQHHQRTIDEILNLPTTEQRFADFHEANPLVYSELVKAARQFRQQTGRQRCGMSLLFGRVRWVLSLQTKGDVFRLNNDYLPFYSRLVMAQEPDLAGMFDTRRSVADVAA